MFPILIGIHKIIFSIINHIFISQNLCDYVVKYYSVCDELDNQSGHAPLVRNLNIGSEAELINVSEKSYTPRKI